MDLHSFHFSLLFYSVGANAIRPPFILFRAMQFAPTHNTPILTKM